MHGSIVTTFHPLVTLVLSVGLVVSFGLGSIFVTPRRKGR